jgi:hypothetical protein
MKKVETSVIPHVSLPHHIYESKVAQQLTVYNRRECVRNRMLVSLRGGGGELGN